MIFLRLFFVFTFISLMNGSYFSQSALDRCLTIHEAYLDEAYKLTQNTVGFSAPISARTYAYITLGMYESVRHLAKNPDISQKTHLTIDIDYPDDIIWEVMANEVNYHLLSYFYRAMPPYDSKRLSQLYIETGNTIAIPRRERRNISTSKEYGQKIAQTIIQHSRTDGGDDGFAKNYPERYLPKRCTSCWVRTTPGYLPAMLPLWGKNLPIVNTELYDRDSFHCLPYSTDTTSQLYKDALEVLQIGKENDPNYEIIAEYWDDGPGISGTPPGHLFQLSTHLRNQFQLSPERAIQLYAYLGLVLNEAFISCWEMKYTHNFIRPITYIHRHLDNNFNTRIDTPPFPESPSGHSFQSGAAGMILIHFFGDTITFTDTVNEDRNDIDGTPRTFHSISQLMKEISDSRLYGGIHFRTTLNDSLEAGKKLGTNFLSFLLNVE
jgi:hypothetical protein